MRVASSLMRSVICDARRELVHVRFFLVEVRSNCADPRWMRPRLMAPRPSGHMHTELYLIERRFRCIGSTGGGFALFAPLGLPGPALVGGPGLPRTLVAGSSTGIYNSAPAKRAHAARIATWLLANWRQNVVGSRIHR